MAVALHAASCGKDRDTDAATSSTAAAATTTAAGGSATTDGSADSSSPGTSGETDPSTPSTASTGSSTAASDTATTDAAPTTEATPDAPMFGDAPWPCGPGDGNNADDGSTPGVTKDSIKIADGDDAGYAGSPGLNHEMTDAMNAMIGKCNELGGINGRIITADYYDAKLFEVGPAIQAACDSGAFFLVGEGWAFDANQEETRLACGLPAVPSYVTSPAFAHGKDMFVALPNPADEASGGQYAQWAKLFPDGVTKAVGLVGAFTATQDSRDRAVAVSPQYGWKWNSSTIEYNPTGEADWTPFVKQIQDADAGIVYYSGGCLPNMQLFMQSAKANGLDVPVLSDANQGAKSCSDANTDGAMDNLYIRINSVPLDEADAVPAVKDYVDLITASGGDTALLGTNAASSFLLWATAASKCGATLTRECTLANLADTHDWTGHGLHAATDPGGNHPSSCGAILHLQGTSFERVVPTEPGTFECDPSWLAHIDPPTPAAAAAKLDDNRISQQYTPG
jgi:hypothetical protein